MSASQRGSDGSPPSVDPIAVLGDAELRATFLHVRGSDRAVTAAETGVALGVHRTVARWRLERLAGAGLVIPGFERRTGRTGPGAGRPAKTYAVAPETRQVEFPARRYDELLALMIAALPRRGRQRRLAEVGVRFGQGLARLAELRPARRPAAAAQRVGGALRTLGFQVTVESADARQIVFSTQTCPLRPLVVTEPEAREIDRGLWRAFVAEGIAGTGVAHVGCETSDCLAAGLPCRVVVTLPGFPPA
jgi:predicted ArsR family transcriptional regulator